MAFFDKYKYDDTHLLLCQLILCAIASVLSNAGFWLFSDIDGPRRALTFAKSCRREKARYHKVHELSNHVRSN
jgi:hypothetical protein